MNIRGQRPLAIICTYVPIGHPVISAGHYHLIDNTYEYKETNFTAASAGGKIRYVNAARNTPGRPGFFYFHLPVRCAFVQRRHLTDRRTYALGGHLSNIFRGRVYPAIVRRGTRTRLVTTGYDCIREPEQSGQVRIGRPEFVV